MIEAIEAGRGGITRAPTPYHTSHNVYYVKSRIRVAVSSAQVYQPTKFVIPPSPPANRNASTVPDFLTARQLACRKFKQRSPGRPVLRVGGKTVDYYSTAAASIGFQLGAQAKSIVILFVDVSALRKFRASEGWKVGVDGSVALVDIGVGKAVDTENIKDPVIGFVFGQKGLMYNLTLEGAKFTRLDKK